METAGSVRYREHRLERDSRLRPGLAGQLVLVLALTSTAMACGTGPEGDATTGTHAAKLAQSAVDGTTSSASGHLLVLVSYQNGIFKAEKVTRVPGALKQPRSGRTRGPLSYVAAGAGTRMVGGAPDPRRVHIDAMNPRTQRMEKREIPAPNKQHLLLHVPEATESLELYESTALNPPQQPSSAAAPRQGSPGATSAGAPLATLSLKGLL